VPRPATVLPTAEEVYARLDRPPWRAVSSVELAGLLGIHLNTVWNWTMRGTGPEPEPEGVHVRASNRRFFNLAVALAWLADRDGAPVEPWRWCRRWLAERRLCDGRFPDPDAAEVARVVAHLETWQPFLRLHRRRWRVRESAYLSRIAELLSQPVAAPPAASSAMPGGPAAAG
jgi:hypothetical protein